MTTENFPEAGGVAWMDVYSVHGARVNLTARAATPAEALDLLVAGVLHAKEKYQMITDPREINRNGSPAPEAPAKTNGAPAPVQAPAAPAPTQGTGEEIVTFAVERIEAQVTPNGKPQFKVFGGPFTKYGVTCWPETLAEKFDLEGVEAGASWSPDGLTARALKSDGKVKKVVGWS